MSNFLLEDKLLHYINAGFPIIHINSFEENKVDEIIKITAHGREILEWNGSNGYVDFQTKTSFFKNEYSLEDTLTLLKAKKKSGCELNRKLLVLKDIYSQINEPRIIALLKDISIQINMGVDASIIIVSPILSIPKELEKYMIVLEMDYLNTEKIKQVIDSFIENNCPGTIVFSDLMEEMTVAFKGLSEFEINNILALSYADDGELSRSDLSLIFEQKQQMIKKAGILEMIPLKESLEDIGGLDNLKLWLKRKAYVFKNINKAIEFGVGMPKGVLITGIPGCGKSLSAKAAAQLFDVPLLLLDMGRIMGKYVGESEGNMRKAIALAEAISPCVLWIDELEKAFSGIGGDGGNAEVTTRLLGNFLTWLQEKESSTFVVATANDIRKLPPELLRKGRFDEIFYVELPNEKERNEIFKIHIEKRRKKYSDKIKIKELVQNTQGYSGGDIEGVIKESIEIVFKAGKEKLMTNDISNVIKDTYPLSKIMKDTLDHMSKEYEKHGLKNASGKTS